MNNSLEKFPFLTWGRYLEQDYIGIIGNSDKQLTSMYIFNIIREDREKEIFLHLGDEWWWETNRMIPINVYYKERWKLFKPYMKTFITKDFEIVSGPTISIDELPTKKIKKRSIQLVVRYTEDDI